MTFSFMLFPSINTSRFYSPIQGKNSQDPTGVRIRSRYENGNFAQVEVWPDIGPQVEGEIDELMLSPTSEASKTGRPSETLIGIE